MATDETDWKKLFEIALERLDRFKETSQAELDKRAAVLGKAVALDPTGDHWRMIEEVRVAEAGLDAYSTAHTHIGMLRPRQSDSST